MLVLKKEQVFACYDCRARNFLTSRVAIGYLVEKLSYSFILF